MHTTLSKQFLQITIAFLICTGGAWGQTYDTIGQKSTANEGFTCLTNRTIWNVQSSRRYIASVGDTVESVQAWTQYADSIMIGIYTVSGGVPTAIFKADTFAVGTGSAWDSSAVKWALVPGNEYCLAVANADLSGGSTEFKDLSTGGDSIMFNNTAPWSSYTSLNLYACEFAAYARVAQYGGAAGVPLSIGTAIIGATKLAPPQ